MQIIISGNFKNSTIKLNKHDPNHESYNELKDKVNKLEYKYEDLLNKYEELKIIKENEIMKMVKKVLFDKDIKAKFLEDLEKLKLTKYNYINIQENEDINENSIKINLEKENKNINLNNLELDNSFKIDISNKFMTDGEIIIEAEKIKNNIDGFFQLDKNKFKAINYDLSKLKINCGKEEIQALISDGNKKGIKKEDINDYILEKLALVLPQDILVNLKISGPKQSKNLFKLLNFYKKGEHSNFSEFLEKLKFKKNIVYTFTDYEEDIFDENYKINNIIFGEIKKENIKFLELNFHDTNTEFEKYIDYFLNEDNLKVCIIKFLPYEGSYMKYIDCYIDNKIKININKKYEKKIFIFMVYMSRIFFEELNNIKNKTLEEKQLLNKKILTETLSNLTRYYQIFIDNLKGDPKLKIENILVIKKKELFINLINPDQQLKSNLYKYLCYFKYNIITSYKGITNNNYLSKLQ